MEMGQLPFLYLNYHKKLNMNNIRIAITDDDALIVKLLEDFLNNCHGYEVSFTAHNGEELIQKLGSSQFEAPDILLLDLKMKNMNGIEVTQYLKIHFPNIKIIVISSYYQDSFLGFMFKTGASAFIPKGISPVHLLNIINTVNSSGIYFMEEQTNFIRTQISEKAPRPSLNESEELSKREIEILDLICKQKTAKEIGEILFITPKTVEGHKNNLFAKTGARNTAGLVVYAIQNKILNVDDIPII